MIRRTVRTCIANLIKFLITTARRLGASLVKLGRAHCKVATLQETYARNLEETFLTSLSKFAEDVKEYEALRKKLESRRCVSIPIDTPFMN